MTVCQVNTISIYILKIALLESEVKMKLLPQSGMNETNTSKIEKLTREKEGEL